MIPAPCTVSVAETVSHTLEDDGINILSSMHVHGGAERIHYSENGK
jgi:hypothetical protein